MEVGSQGHGVDHNRLLLRVVVEDHNLQEPAGSVRTDDEIPAVAWDDSYGMSDGVLHVFVEDAVLASAAGDLHHDKVVLSDRRVKVTLSTGVSVSLGN
jgi:hypothetical protein